MRQRGAILLSGGVDSAALAALIKPGLAIFVNYGQVCAVAEHRAAEAIATALELEFTVVQADCRLVGSGDLSGTPALALAPASEWWPYRNQLLATLAASRALSLKCDRLIFGSVSTDGTHADGRREFFALLDALLVYQEGGLRVEAPAIELTTVDLVKQAKVDLSLLGWDPFLSHV